MNKYHSVHFLKAIFVLALFLVFSAPAFAHTPVIVEQQTVGDITQIADPDLSQAFYGVLNDFPHTFEVRADKPFKLHTEILVPDIEESTNNISGIIIKEQGKGKRVLEVARLSAKEATWESEFEPFGGDTYRHGSSFDKELDAGVYRIEVHTPDNRDKYVLVVGTREEMSIGYFELIGRMIEVKKFFGKSPFMIIESPFVYIPLLLILIIGGVVWYVRKRRSARV